MKKTLVPLTLVEHQQVLYEMLYMIDDFCKDHSIPYFLIGGTLLGAVRHQGFIPWDDDVDIAMTRANYERFIKEYHACPVEGYELYDIAHNEDYLSPFARMTKIDSMTDCVHTHRIFVDILVIDGCGDDLALAQTYFESLHQEIYDIRRFFTFSFRRQYNCWKAKVIYLLKEFPKDLVKYYPLRVFKKKRDILANKYSKCLNYSVESCLYSACIVAGLYGKGEVQPSKSFLELVFLKFGERELPVPSLWHEYLCGIYGDYMTLPPIEKRKIHLKQSYLLTTEVSDEQI